MERKYRLKSMPHAQCHVSFCTDKNGFIEVVKLISYSTHVASFQFDQCTQKWEYVVFSKWGNTTAKHINKFIEEFSGIIRIYRAANLGEYYQLTQQQHWRFFANVEEYSVAGKPYYGHY